MAIPPKGRIGVAALFVNGMSVLYSSRKRAGMSKQAMNRLLGSLKELGYLARSDAPGEGRVRIVCFTQHGQAAWAKALEVHREIEREWAN